jgi:UDP-N-acetylmuramoyl-L-alanyl-D-glutamate--2,6-diaminopimelate ligase
MELKELIQASEGILKWHNEINWQTQIRGICSDSRKIESGYIFVAIKGERSDGHRFIAQALAQGASFVVIEDNKYCQPNVPWILADSSRKAMGQMLQAFLGYPSRKMRVIGVTGTNGKTTVTNMLANILEAYQKKVGLIGTIHNRIGKDIIAGKLTTPDVPELADLFRKMAEQKVDYVVMEVSSHALAQNRVAGVEFDLAVFTNLTQDHLDYHGSMENYLFEKSRLFSQLDPQGYKKQKMAILNMDDKHSSFLADHCRVPVITYGLAQDCLVRATDVQMDREGFAFQLHYANQAFPIKMKLAGYFNVYNALAAAAVALVEGIPVPVIQKALQDMAAVSGRFQKVEVAAPYSVFVDYSHTPDSLKNCIQTAKAFCPGRVITVFGAGGHRDRGKRPIMGEIAGKFSDVCIVTSDNPRDEEPEAIIRDILAGMTGSQIKARIFTQTDRRKAIEQAIELAQDGDVVLICGKGHESYQIIGDQVLHFDDYEEAEEIMQKRQNNVKE